jgi:hypothetical protein
MKEDMADKLAVFQELFLHTARAAGRNVEIKMDLDAQALCIEIQPGSGPVYVTFEDILLCEDLNALSEGTFQSMI